MRSSGQTGTDRVGWCACPWLTLFATEWSAARRKRSTAAVLHLRAAISADVKAVRFRRAAAENFRPEILEARATLRSQRESAVGRRPTNRARPRLPEDRTARLRNPSGLSRLPGQAAPQLNEERVCQYENSSNGDLLIDRHPTAPNVLLVGAGSGHGFKHGPEVGRYAAELLTGRLKNPESRFSLATKAEQQNRAVH